MTAESKHAPPKLQKDLNAWLFFLPFFCRPLSNVTPGNLPADQRAFENWQVATSHRKGRGGGGGGLYSAVTQQPFSLHSLV